ncbi:hypothetical protein GOODEAATRI_012040 [Goodea atripinnis]|uniref:Uncharacterized protein n=1 Tax=Goodea atripinnis TaxID=208336 RepID=A0ABV0P3H1_9TELE
MVYYFTFVNILDTTLSSLFSNFDMRNIYQRSLIYSPAERHENTPKIQFRSKSVHNDSGTTFLTLQKMGVYIYMKRGGCSSSTPSVADLLACPVCAQQGNIMQCYEWSDNNELPPRG